MRMVICLLAWALIQVLSNFHKIPDVAADSPVYYRIRATRYVENFIVIRDILCLFLC